MTFTRYCFYFETGHRKRLGLMSSHLTVVLVSDRSAAVVKAGGGAAVKELCVADRTESDMREKQKHCSRSAGFVDRRVIVHRSADRGAVRLCTFCLLSAYCAPALLAVKPPAFSVVIVAACGFTGELQINRKVASQLPLMVFSLYDHWLMSEHFTHRAAYCSSFMSLGLSQVIRQEEKLQWAMQLQGAMLGLTTEWCWWIVRGLLEVL